MEGVPFFNRIVQKDLTKNVTYEQRTEEVRKQAMCLYGEKSINSKNPEAEACLLFEEQQGNQQGWSTRKDEVGVPSYTVRILDGNEVLIHATIWISLENMVKSKQCDTKA